MILLVGCALLAPAWAGQPEPADARARSCTGWNSTSTPPDTIRVGRNAGRGPVETVNFRRYVGVVMAKEWPAHLPPAALEAAAVAVKQYAWYHALAGNHRSSFRTSGGCYDVVDSTRDQLYKPELVGVGRSIRSAVNKTWGLSLRKGGKFFMTGYRRGGDRACGSDSDGWRLYARSMIDCAKKGLSREEIQVRYYGRNVRFVWAGGAQSAPPPRPPRQPRQPASGGDGGSSNEGSRSPAQPAPTPPPPPPDPPEPPQIALSLGMSGAADGLSVSWAGSDDGLRYAVQQLVEDEWVTVTLPTRTATALAEAVDFDPAGGDDRRFRVRAVDRNGLRSRWTVSPSVTARPYADIGGPLGFMGNWRWRAEAATPGVGVISYNTDAEGAASVLVEARAVALLGTAGPQQGRVRILVDGVEHGVADLKAPDERADAVIFSHEWEAEGTHVIRLEPVGDSGAAPRVEALIVYR